MSLKNKAFLFYAKPLIKEIDTIKENPIPSQKECFNYLISNGVDTFFGKQHNFSKIKDIDSFRKNIPIRDYNDFYPFIEKLRQGEDYILWNQKVKWFAKSSGTSSDKSKFIPLTPDSLYQNHYGGFKRMLANYIRHNPESGIFSGKALTLGGSVVCDGKDYEKKYYSGDLSAILLSNSPKIAELHRTPSRKIALMADFTKKTAEICKICSKVNVTNFSGVPSWNLMLMNKILDYTGKKSLLDVWPNLELFMHGGIGFTPYKSIFNELIPTQRMNYLENYNASEGYFAFQDDLNVDGMLLCTANGVYYEFIPMDKFNKVMRGESDDVISLDEVKIGVNYAIVVSTVSGLWRYLIGDCVKFVSIYPHRVKVSGRTQLYINAFGEELMIDNAEKAIYTTCNELGCRVKEFTVSPHFMALNENNQAVKGYHKWAIEFSKPPIDMDLFEKKLDYNLTQVNSDYEAKRKNNSTMERLRVFPLKEGTFYLWMEKREKVGGQNKVPRLYPDTHFFDELIKINNSIK